MAKVIIRGKEHTCSEPVKDEIDWLRIKLKATVSIAQKIEDKQDEIDSLVREKQAEIQELLNQLKYTF